MTQGAPRWEFEVIRADDSTVDTINGQLSVKHPLHLYLTEKAAEGWDKCSLEG